MSGYPTQKNKPPSKCFVTIEVLWTRRKREERSLQPSMSQANKIGHECVSVDALVEYLKQRCGRQDIHHQKVPRGNDPPDFWLFIDGKTFAVEETSLAEEATVKASATARKKGSTHNFFDAKWEGEVQDKLTELIGSAVCNKRVKLERKGVPQQCPDVILLLYDAYGFGDAEDAKIALQKCNGYDWFHSVFWAASFTDRLNDLYPKVPGRIGSFLYTKEDRWKG